MNMIVKILEIEQVTHNVKRFRVQKPEGYEYIPGQATEVSINKEGWEDNKHPFTFTSLNRDNYLEFTIKIYPTSTYPTHSGMTEKLGTLVVGDELIIDHPWGTINYKGKGVFIAGGAGITPFIAILRDLHSRNELSGNTLIFSNKTENDIILKDELVNMFKDNPEDLVFVLTQEEKTPYHFGRINEGFIQKYITTSDKNFYVCGPRPMVKEILAILESKKVDSLIFEK